MRSQSRSAYGYNEMAFHSTWRSNRNYLPFVMAIHSKWLRNNPQGPKGPLGPEGAQGARRAPPLGPIGSLGPRRCAPANLKKTRNDIMALRVRFVATLLHSKGAAAVPQRVLGYLFACRKLKILCVFEKFRGFSPFSKRYKKSSMLESILASLSSILA